ncbi:MAG: endonuclease/exonuclease/phosphatase family protein [Granulosicoccus sp.]|nr:endonuclease/exonuclease/phosphatase family protein [Granulosicoccus sp.]
MRGKRVSFATYNLLNFNLPNKGMYGKPGWDTDTYQRKVDWSADILKKVDADVWGFQELWHREAFEDVFARARLRSAYELLVPRGTAGSGIVCAGAVRKGLLVGEPQWIVNFPDNFVLRADGDDEQTCEINVDICSFSRPILRFEVKPRSGGKRIVVFVAHLKSKSPTRVYKESWYSKPVHGKHAMAIGAALSTIRRTAEAAALRWLLSEEAKDTSTPVVVLGDLNDGQHSNTLNILTEQPGYLFGDSKGGVDNGLYTVGTLQEYRSLRDIYYTHIYKRKRESLDHILVSEQFYDNSRERLWRFDEMCIYNDHLNDDDHGETGTSDHGIVKATFQYSRAKSKTKRSKKKSVSVA